MFLSCIVGTPVDSSGTVRGRRSPAPDRRRPKGPFRPATALRPLLHPPPHYSASEGIGGARGLGNLVRPESHTRTPPEPRGFPVGRPAWRMPTRGSSWRVNPLPVSPFDPALLPACCATSREIGLSLSSLSLCCLFSHSVFHWPPVLSQHKKEQPLNLI